MCPLDYMRVVAFGGEVYMPRSPFKATYFFATDVADKWVTALTSRSVTVSLNYGSTKNTDARNGLTNALSMSGYTCRMDHALHRAWVSGANSGICF